MFLDSLGFQVYSHFIVVENVKMFNDYEKGVGFIGLLMLC